MLVVSSIRHFFCNDIPREFHALKIKIYILAIEIFAVLVFVIPQRVKWCFTKTKQYKLEVEVNGEKRVGYLYCHKKSGTTPLLFLHGDHGHPSNLLHLVEKGKTSFSLYIPKIHCGGNEGLVEQAIKKVKEECSSKEVKGVGHSRGSYLLMHSSVDSLFSIAGRLNSTRKNKKIVQIAPKFDWSIPQSELRIPGYVSVDASHLSALYSKVVVEKFAGQGQG